MAVNLLRKPTIAVIASARFQLIRAALALLAGLTVAGCGSQAQDPVLQSVTSALAQMSKGPSVQTPVIEQQMAIRRAVAEQRLQMPLLMMTLANRRAVATLGLVQDTGTVQTWADASGITITVQSGVVIETRGLGHDLMASSIGALEHARSARTSMPYTRVWQVLDPAGELSLKTANCQLAFGAVVQTEICRGETNFENLFPNTHTGASRQWLGPELGYLSIEPLT